MDYNCQRGIVLKRITNNFSYDDEFRLVMRYLEGNQWKCKETYEAIINHKKFLDTMYPLIPSNVAIYMEMLNRGVCYLHKRDRSFRPIFIFSVKKFPQLGSNFE